MNKVFMAGVAAMILTHSSALDARGAEPAVEAVNTLGVELLGKTPRGNAVLSPYSIQSALAMAFAGAAAETRAEMARVLHFPDEDAELHRSFATLQKALADVYSKTAARASNSKRWGGPSEPITLAVANRLYGQDGYAFRETFLSLVKDRYAAPLERVDFRTKAEASRAAINAWVEQQTQRRIRDLIPQNGVDQDTRMVLVNAVYMKAPWMEEFYASATESKPFHVAGAAPVDVPTMHRRGRVGHSQKEGFSVVTLPYTGGELQFVALVPDAADGLAALESKLSAAVLADCAETPGTEVILYLPKFKLEPPLLKLGAILQQMGMKRAFDQPRGSANFDRMAPRKPDDYLALSEVFHKTFLALDERGTEAAAATAAVAVAASAVATPAKPVVMKVDRPFVFAIQHRPSGACLFLGRVTDPRGSQ